MAQIGQPGRTAAGQTQNIAMGGVRAWRLPPDASCASAARSLLRAAMTTLGLGGDVLAAAVLAVSDLATNALSHGLRGGAGEPVIPPELWMWARATPVPQLVVAVFDICRASWPDMTHSDLLDEHGRGLEIVGVVADAWGAHLSRSRLDAGPKAAQTPGKMVWCAFALPGPRPGLRLNVPPSSAARDLAGALAARGIENVRHRHEDRVSLVSVPLSGGDTVNVWVDSGRLAFTDLDGRRIHRPVIDLHDVAEHLVRRSEERSGR